MQAQKSSKHLMLKALIMAGQSLLKKRTDRNQRKVVNSSGTP